VITRDLSRDLSASHLLRVATWDRQRGAEVVVFLIDRAVGADGPGGSRARLEALATAGVPLFASSAVLAHLGDDAARLGIVAASDEDLAPLMREPGMRAVWC
jgi:hypothetical protein